jgi:hypothetical protein
MSYNGELGRSVSLAQLTNVAASRIGDLPSQRWIVPVFLPSCEMYELRHARASGLRRSLLRS